MRITLFKWGSLADARLPGAQLGIVLLPRELGGAGSEESPLPDGRQALRKVKEVIDFTFVREEVADCYGYNGNACRCIRR